MSLEVNEPQTGRRYTNEPGFSPLREKRCESDTKEGQTYQYREHRQKRAGRAMSSRSAVIVPETGEPRPKEP